MSEKIIALDAGHGMGTLGKRCLKSIDPLQTREWYLNDRIADMVEAELAAYFCRVVRAEDTTGARMCCFHPALKRPTQRRLISTYPFITMQA